MIGGRVFAPVQGDGPLGGVVVNAIIRVQIAMFAGLLFVAQECVDQAQVVVCRRIFRVELQRFLEPSLRFT